MTSPDSIHRPNVLSMFILLIFKQRYFRWRGDADKTQHFRSVNIHNIVTHAYTSVVQRTKSTRKLVTASHYFQHFSTPVTTLEAVSFHKIKHVRHKILYMYSIFGLLNSWEPDLPGDKIFCAAVNLLVSLI